MGFLFFTPSNTSRQTVPSLRALPLRYFDLHLPGGRPFSNSGRPRPSRHSLSDTFWIETQNTEDLSQSQRKSHLSAFYLATQAATMTKPLMKEEAQASPGATKAYKRKRKPGEERYYAVRSGRTPGIYTTWLETRQQIDGFAGAACKYPFALPSPFPPSSFTWKLAKLPVTFTDKAFPTREEASLFVEGKNPNPDSTPDRFYAVAVGNRPGIYTFWPDAQAAYTGVKAPKYKKFETREAAEEWMQGFAHQYTSITHGGAKMEDDDDEGEEEDDQFLPAGKKVKVKDEIEVTFGGDTTGLEEIYTDGSTLSNGQEGAVAGVGVFFGDNDPRFVQHNTSPFRPNL